MAVLEGLEAAVRGGGSCTDAEARIAAYALAHADEVIHASIADMAAATYSSNATIVRLCRKLGVSGFREFKIELASDLEKRRVARAHVDADYPVAPADRTADVLSSIAALTKEAVDAAYASVDPHDVDRAARFVRRARNVYLFAVGDSQITAESFLNLLVKIGVNGVVAGRHGEYGAVAHAARPGDVAFFISYSGGFLDRSVLRDVPATLRARRVATVLVSAAPEVPSWIDCALRFPMRERDAGKMATFYSQTCIRYLLNSVYAAVFALDYAGSLAAKSSLDSA